MSATSTNHHRERTARVIRHLRARIEAARGDHKHGLSSVRDGFRKFASHASAAVGSPWAFALAVLVIVVWALMGPMFKFSDTWQLVINTGTTIVTFLMVFLIQNTQNRDARAIHLKLDELIRANKDSRDTLVDLEECSDEELAELEDEFRRFRDERRRAQASEAKAR